MTNARTKRALISSPLLVGIVASLFCARPAEAISGLYLQLGAGYGSFTGTDLVVNETGAPGDIPDLDPKRCCPSPGLGMQFRTGFSILGFAGPEVAIVGNGWDIGSSAGGAGFFGGGLRLFPVKFIGLLGPDTKGFPIDVGLGAIYGYTLVGKDFAYTGTFFGFDANIDYLLTDHFSLGVRFDVIKPTYDDFQYTDYNNDRGRCLDGDGNSVGDRGKKDELSCNGSGPSTLFISPQVVLTFRIELLDV